MRLKKEKVKRGKPGTQGGEYQTMMTKTRD